MIHWLWLGLTLANKIFLVSGASENHKMQITMKPRGVKELFGEDYKIAKIPKLPPRHVTFNERYQFHSRLYDQRPQSIADLLMSRKIVEHCEIAQLSLLPVAEKVIIASEYVEDLRELM